MKQLIVDTTVLVECLRKNPVAQDFIKENLPVFSTVTRAELIQGSKNQKELTIISNFLQDMEESFLNERIALLAINLMEKYYLSHHLLFLDALIAATAITENLTLVTGNHKHFSFLPDLDLKDWKEFEK